MSTIYINGRFMTRKMTGEQRYAFEIVVALDKILCCSDNTFHEWKLIVPGRILPQYSSYSFKKIKVYTKSFLRGHLWEQVELPLLAGKELLLNFCDMAPVVKKNQIVTIHDMILKTYPQNYSKLFLWWHLTVFYLLRHRVKQFCTVSAFSKQEISHYMHIPENNIEIVSPAAFTNKFLDNIDKKNISSDLSLPDRYIMATGSLSQHKNFIRLAMTAEFLAEKNISLVVAGMSDHNIFSNSNVQKTKNIIYLGYISNDDLVHIYRNAICFVMPSLYEGFGIPPLEAMSCGCPVAASNIEALKEVCGDAAVYFNPFSEEDILQKLLLLIDDERLRKTLIDKGYTRVKQYSWYKSAEKLIEIVYNNI